MIRIGQIHTVSYDNFVKPASAGFELLGSAIFLMQRYWVQYLKTFTDKNIITTIFSKKKI